MKWHKTNIQLENLPKLIKQIEEGIKVGNTALEIMRCVYTTEDNLVHCLTPFDFIDSFNEDLKIKTFYLYQVLEN